MRAKDILEASSLLAKPFAIRVSKGKAQVVSVTRDSKTRGVIETPQCAWMSGAKVLEFVRSHSWLHASACERFYRSHGFRLFGTGGGCVAYRRDISDEVYILVTAWGDAQAPKEVGEKVACGMYRDGESEAREWIRAAHGEAAMMLMQQRGWIKT